MQPRPTKNKLLLVDDDPMLLRAFARSFRAKGWAVSTHHVQWVRTPDGGVASDVSALHVRIRNADVVLSDFQLGGSMNGGHVAAFASMHGKPCAIWSGNTKAIPPELFLTNRVMNKTDDEASVREALCEIVEASKGESQ
ncbi:MAG: hypothetical protein MJA83_05785 [Gammaproteobacteria bacterium]|nr:hypothetical protein [Gammaproteobacteria bacterium]